MSPGHQSLKLFQLYQNSLPWFSCLTATPQLSFLYLYFCFDFLLLARISNLLPKSRFHSDPQYTLLRKDVSVTSSGLNIALPSHPLCRLGQLGQLPISFISITCLGMRPYLSINFMEGCCLSLKSKQGWLTNTFWLSEDLAWHFCILMASF